MQTATEWLIDKIVQDQMYKALSQKEWIDIFEQAKEMGKQQMQDFGARCCLMTKQKNEWTLEQYYNETYGSKGSDVCDYCKGKGKIFHHEFGQFVKCGVCQSTSSQTEISDEEIDKAAYYMDKTSKYFFKYGAKWYREQLKSKK